MFNLLNRPSGFNKYDVKKNPKGLRAYVYKICNNTLIDFVRMKKASLRMGKKEYVFILSLDTPINISDRFCLLNLLPNKKLEEVEEIEEEEEEIDCLADLYDKFVEDINLFSFEVLNSIPNEKISKDLELTWKDLYLAYITGTEKEIARKYSLKDSRLWRYKERLRQFISQK